MHYTLWTYQRFIHWWIYDYKCPDTHVAPTESSRFGFWRDIETDSDGQASGDAQLHSWRPITSITASDCGDDEQLWVWGSALTPHLDSMNEVSREASVTLFPLRDGVMELTVSMFWGFWARCARDRPRRPSPRLSILMQTRSLSTQRGYISHTKDVLSPDTTHTVSNVLIQSCFVSLSQSVWVLSGTGLEQWGIHTQTHT